MGWLGDPHALRRVRLRLNRFPRDFSGIEGGRQRLSGGEPPELVIAKMRLPLRSSPFAIRSCVQ